MVVLVVLLGGSIGRSDSGSGSWSSVGFSSSGSSGSKSVRAIVDAF